MKERELHALADALEPMAKAPRFADFDVPGFCEWVRACADAEPVARIYTDAEMVHRDERWGRVQWIEPESELAEGTLLYTHPAPAAPQAEPCIGNDSACPCQDGDACHYKDAADGTKAWPVPQAEPKREPLSDERIDEIGDPFGYFQYGDAQGDKRRAFARAVERAAYERAAQECEAQISGSDHHYLATHGHWDHMAQAATNCADAIRALGRK